MNEKYSCPVCGACPRYDSPDGLPDCGHTAEDLAAHTRREVVGAIGGGIVLVIALYIVSILMLAM